MAKKKKRETRRMRKARLNPGAVVKAKGRKAKPPTDESLDEVLNGCLLEIAHQSSACFKFAFKCFEKQGRGCLFWLFRDISHAKAFEKLGNDMPCLSYHSEKLAETFEYPPVMEFIKKYDPRSHYVALVAIRTGDRRDSLMKVTHLRKTAHLQAFFQVERRLQSLPFKGGKGLIWLSNKTRLCSNAMCSKAESKAGEFKKCAGCQHRAYCTRGCQILHWKSVHKTSCAAEKEWAALDKKMEETIALQKQNMQIETEVKRLQAEKNMLEDSKRGKDDTVKSEQTDGTKPSNAAVK